MINIILCDIEGTTTSISFVHDVLFPLSRKQIDAYLESQDAQTHFESDLNQLRYQLSGKLGKSVEEITTKDLANYFKDLIDNDVKDTLLKKIQGRIWKQAYEAGQVKGHMYPDVKPKWEAWTKNGKKIAIYSSGSVEAQKLIFRYSEAGDLTPFISAYFDTTTGPKKEKTSYLKIADVLQEKPENILFLSDHPEELKAAREAGYQVVQLVRPPEKPSSNAEFPQVTSFEEIHVD